jgi:chorismate-pyruvate lyase
MRVTNSSSIEAALEEQHSKLEELNEMLTAYCEGRMTAHDLIIRVHAETGFQVQTLERDSMRLIHVHETPLGNILSEIHIID